MPQLPCPPAALREALISRYSEPHRHYHTLDHIYAMLKHFAAFGSLCRQPELIDAAIWFHDAIYNPTRRDNEARSADLATEYLSDIGWSDDACRRVASLIHMTAKHAALPGDYDAALLMDLDLSILAAEPSAYDDYVDRIRREYAHVSDDVFGAGRQAFITHLLARTHIYATPALFEAWEGLARRNLERERRVLTGGGYA